MSYKEAYKLLKEKFPDSSAKTCAVYDDLYIFNMVPDSLETTPDGVGFYDNTWSVNKNTGHIEQMSFLENLEIISKAEMLEIN